MERCWTSRRGELVDLVVCDAWLLDVSMKDIEAPIKDEDATMLEERVNIM